MRCFISRRCVPAMRRSSERMRGSGRFERACAPERRRPRHRRRLRFVARHQPEQQRVEDKQGRDGESDHTARCRDQPGRCRQRGRLWLRCHGNDRRGRQCGQHQKQRPHRLRHQPGGERFGLVSMGTHAGSSIAIRRCTGRPDAASRACACAGVGERPVATSHAATAPALRWKPSAQQTSTVPWLRASSIAATACACAAGVGGKRSTMADCRPAAGDAARPLQFAGKVDHRAEAPASAAVGKRPRKTPSAMATCGGSLRVHAHD